MTAATATAVAVTILTQPLHYPDSWRWRVLKEASVSDLRSKGIERSAGFL